MSQVASTSVQAAQAARMRETQQEMSRDFKRVAACIEHQYQHARLLPSKRGPAAGLDGVEEGLIKESSGLKGSLQMCDEVIGAAMATRDMVSNQNKTLRESKSKLGSVESLLPGVGKLIGQITDRKNTEATVLSATVA